MLTPSLVFLREKGALKDQSGTHELVSVWTNVGAFLSDRPPNLSPEVSRLKLKPHGVTCRPTETIPSIYVTADVFIGVKYLKREAGHHQLVSMAISHFAFNTM